MNRRLKQLSNSLDLPIAPPPFHLDPKLVRRRVRDTLTAAPRERKLYMKQKVRFAAVLTAAVVGLTGAALAVGSNWNVLQAWFEGDTSSAEAFMDREERSVSDKNYTFTVDSSVSDGQTAFLLVRIDALSEAGRVQLNADDFLGIDTFSIYALVKDPESGKLTHPQAGAGAGMSEVKEARTETSRTWRADVRLPASETAVAVHARLGYMDEGLALQVPLSPVKTVTVEVNATGQGFPNLNNTHGGPVTLERAVVTPFNLTLEISWPEDQADPPVLPVVFRMADGSLRSFQQLLDGSGLGNSWSNIEKSATFVYHFREVQDLDNLSGVVVWGKEYPLDGSAPREVAVDGHLLPFAVPLMPGLSDDNPNAMPVRALCDGLGASCVWDNDAKTATLQFRGSTVVLTWGGKTAQVDGKPYELRNAPDARDGKLCVDGSLADLWNLDYQSPFNEDRTARTCFIIIP